MIYVCGPGPRRTGHGRQHLSRRHVQRVLSGHLRGRGGDAEAVQAVLVPGRHPQPRRARDSRIDPRGRRARIRALARVRRRLRQPRSDRRLRGRRRRGGDRSLAASWHSNKFLNPASDGAVLPILHLNGYKIANPDDPRAHRAARSSRACSSATGTSPTSSRASDPQTMHRLMAETLDHGHRRDQGDPARRARERRRATTAVADDRPAHAEGLDGAEGGRRQEDRGLLALSSGPDGGAGDQPGAHHDARGVDAELPARRSSSTRTARSCRSSESSRRRATAGWERIRTPTAACSSRDLRMPDFRDYAVEVPSPGTVIAEATRVLGEFLRDSDEDEPRDAKFPRLRVRTSSRRTASARCFEVTGRSWLADTTARGRPPRARRSGDGDPERAHLPGLARGLSPDRPSRVLHTLRGVRPRRRLDVQPAREVAEGDAQRDPVAAADRLSQLPAHLARLAAGSQRLLTPGPRLHRPRREQEGRGHPRLSAARCQHAAVRSPTTASAAATSST